MDKIIEASRYIKQSMTREERKVFGAIKRDLVKEIVTLTSSNRIMIDIIACEYIKYVRAIRESLPRIAISCAKAMREYLVELNLTPHSKTETNAASTLSNIFKIINKEDTDGRNH